jgi:hypothetical protein
MPLYTSSVRLNLDLGIYSPLLAAGVFIAFLQKIKKEGLTTFFYQWYDP